jgi:hypothetical protein
MMDEEILEIQQMAERAGKWERLSHIISRLCNYIAQLKHELKDAQARISSLEDLLASLED